MFWHTIRETTPFMLHFVLIYFSLNRRKPSRLSRKVPLIYRIDPLPISLQGKSPVDVSRATLSYT